MGGVRLLVLEKMLMMRKLSLKNFSEDLEQEFGKNKEQCPNCGSYDIEAYTQGKKSAFVAFMFFGLPIFF